MTENMNTKRNERSKPCECRWCVAAQRGDRMELGGMVIAPCDEYGRTDREAASPVLSELVKRIDRDKLAEVIDVAMDLWIHGDGGRDSDCVADAVLAALPDLMGGGEQA